MDEAVSPGQETPPHPTRTLVALFAAEGAEARALGEALGLEQAVKSPKPTHRGIFADHEVVLIEAGVGKVAAASAVTYAQARFEPKIAIWAGVAGALNPKLHALDVLIAHDAVQWDVDITAFGRKPGELASGERFVEADAELSTQLYRAALALNLPVHWGRIASGDRFLADPNEAQRLREVFAADAVEMEGAAALWTAGRLGVPMALVRAISDGAGDEATVNFQEFLEVASRRLGELLARFLRDSF